MTTTELQTVKEFCQTASHADVQVSDDDYFLACHGMSHTDYCDMRNSYTNPLWGYPEGDYSPDDYFTEGNDTETQQQVIIPLWRELLDWIAFVAFVLFLLFLPVYSS